MLTYIVKINYEQFTFETGGEALLFAQNAKLHITDKDVTVKVIIECEASEDTEVEHEEN